MLFYLYYTTCRLKFPSNPIGQNMLFFTLLTYHPPQTFTNLYRISKSVHLRNQSNIQAFCGAFVVCFSYKSGTAPLCDRDLIFRLLPRTSGSRQKRVASEVRGTELLVMMGVPSLAQGWSNSLSVRGKSTTSRFYYVSYQKREFKSVVSKTEKKQSGILQERKIEIEAKERKTETEKTKIPRWCPGLLLYSGLSVSSRMIYDKSSEFPSTIRNLRKMWTTTHSQKSRDDGRDVCRMNRHLWWQRPTQWKVQRSKTWTKQVKKNKAQI